MIKIKELKYKHYRQAQALLKRAQAGEASDDEILTFALSLIEEWDFTDVETGQPLPLGELDELSLSQFNELKAVFEQMKGLGVTFLVPKANDAPSPST